MKDKSAVEKYGVCINDRYCCHHSMKIISPFCPRFPETHKLNLGQTLSSGHGSVSFDSDQDCTDFVHSFFPDCKPYLSSCSQVGELLGITIFLFLQVEKDQDSAVLILGCLFGHYPSLMAPLLSKDQDNNTV